MTINNKSERNYRGKCLGWPVTSYGGAEDVIDICVHKSTEFDQLKSKAASDINAHSRMLTESRALVLKAS